jgi:hypothetical protein
MRHFLLRFGFFGGMVNFAIFLIGALYLGGDALNGRAVDAHYYLANHGHLTEVNRSIFTYSKWHVWSVFVTHPLAMLCAWLLSREPQKRID